jgi:hypothetical protein
MLLFFINFLIICLCLANSEPNNIQSDLCGLSTGWAKNYSNFHQKMLRENGPKTKYLVAIPNLSGLADRVIGFATVLMISILTNRVFQIGQRGNLPSIEVTQ